MTVVFLDDTSAISESDDQQEQTNWIMPPKSLEALNLPDMTAGLPQPRINVEESEDAAANEAAGDQAGHALLFGRYMGQISARIERAWQRPRTQIGAPSFLCRVQINQDRAGNVREVTLQRCGGSVRWQASLVHAIEAASPLPAPPDPDVFSNLVSLEFDADAYVPGGSEEGFEPDTQEAVTAAAADASSSELSALIARLKAQRRPAEGSLDLRIEGPPRGQESPGPVTNPPAEAED